MVKFSECASEHIASGLHGRLPSSGIDAKAFGNGRKRRIDEADLVITDRSSGPIDEREIVRQGERDRGLAGGAIVDRQQRRMVLVGERRGGLARGFCGAWVGMLRDCDARTDFRLIALV